MSIVAGGEIINWGSVINDGGNIDVLGRIENNASMTNNFFIEVLGSFVNNALLTNNRSITFGDLEEGSFNRALLKNSSFGTINNLGTIMLDCAATYIDEGVVTGNPVDAPYCLDGGAWSDPGAWNRGALPPANARIVVQRAAHLDVDFELSGAMQLAKGIVEAPVTLEVDPGVQLTVLADGIVSTNGFSELINYHSIVNFGEVRGFGEIINYADFGNAGLINAARLTNYGLLGNTVDGLVRASFSNRAGGIVDNLGLWEMSSQFNGNNGEFKNHENAELYLNWYLANNSFIDNLGLISLAGSRARLFNGGLIVNQPTGNLNLTESTTELENVNELRNEGAVGNDGTIDNTRGRICGSGDISGSPVIGNAPEPTCNRAPTAVALPDAGVIECTGPTTNVSLDGRMSSDPDLRDELTFSWSPAAGLIDPTAGLTSGNFGLGSKNYTLTVTDLLGESDTDGASFTVRDTAAPAMSCPPETTLVADEMCIGIGDPALAEAVDVCDTNPSVTRAPAGNNWSLGETEVIHYGRDGSGNTATCASVVQVVDETVPMIQCNTDGVVVRPGMPVSFQATATDNCSVTSVAVTAFDCWQINNAGKRVDKTGKCVVSLSGDKINILEPSGVGTIIGWTVDAVDGSGNAATASCEVVSTRPNRN
jgi:hypothetical protein